MHWTEKLSFFALALSLMVIPLDSGTSYVFTCLWIFSIVLKNTLLKRWSFFGWHQDKSYNYGKSAYLLIPMMAYFCLYLLSMIWTANKAVGWGEVWRLAWFVAIPLTCACTDFREVTKTHLRNILWLYVLFMSVLFLVVWAIVIMKDHGVAILSFLDFLTGSTFYYIHHSYMAVYILAGLAFLYSECVSSEKPSAGKIVMIVLCACCLFLFLLFINSRTGSLGLGMLLLMCLSHLCFVRKKYRASVIALVTVLLLGCVVHFMLPDKYKRLLVTTEQVTQGDTSDVRFIIMENAWTVVKENPVLGVGVGDIKDSLIPFYGDLESVFRPHNQYLETWMATGVFGVVALLLMMFLPLYSAFRSRRWLVVSIIIIFAVSNLFESMLERQMGVSFFCVMMAMFVIGSTQLHSQLFNEREELVVLPIMDKVV